MWRRIKNFVSRYGSPFLSCAELSSIRKVQDIRARVSHPFLCPSLWCIRPYTRENGKSPNLFPGNVGKSPNLFSRNVGKSPNLCPKTLLKDIVFVTQRHASSLPIFVCFVSHTDRYAPFGVSNRHSSIASSSSLRAGAEAAGRLSPSCSAELAPTMTEVTPF